jgi:spore germination protein KB
MDLEKGRISNSQLTVLVVSYLQGMILTVDFVFRFTKQGTWLAVLTGFAIALLIACLYTAIIQRFPGKTLNQIDDIAFGPYLGKAVTLGYLWYFLQAIIHYSYFFNSFWITYIMPETPRAAFLIMFMIVCAMAVLSGIEVIARCSFLFFVIVAANVFVVSVLLIGNMDLSNLMPVIDYSLKDFIQSVHLVLTIPFCELVVFLMILPNVSEKTAVRKPVLIGTTLSAVQLLIVVLRDVLVLGPRIINSTSVSFAAARLIDIGDVLTRLDIMVAITLLITAFMKISVFYYALVLGLAQFLKLRSYLHLVVPIGIIATAISVTLYPSDMEQIYAAQYAWPFNASVYQFLLPAVTYSMIAFRRLPRKEGAAGP